MLVDSGFDKLRRGMIKGVLLVMSWLGVVENVGDGRTDV